MDGGGKQRWNGDNEKQRIMYKIKMVGKEVVDNAMHKTNYVNEQIPSF